MSKIKKLLITLIFLILIFPMIASAIGIPSLPGSQLATLAIALPGGTISGIIGNIALWLLGLFGIFGVIGFVLSGILYLVSTGNEEVISKAKRYMLYSIVGVIVGLMGIVILQAAYLMLSGSPIF